MTITLVSINENEFKLQKMADRARSTYNEEQLLFITRNLRDGEKVAVIRRSYGTKHHRNTLHKVSCGMAFFRVANRLETLIRNIPLVAQDIQMKLLRVAILFFIKTIIQQYASPLKN